MPAVSARPDVSQVILSVRYSLYVIGLLCQPDISDVSGTCCIRLLCGPDVL